MPEVVHIESDPWKMVIGSDPPRFVLYEDGQVIYSVDGGFRTVRLNSEELRSFRQWIAAAHHPMFSGGYNVAIASDQPGNDLLFYADQAVFLSVYGSLDDEEVVSRLPGAVQQSFERVRSFRHDSSRPWMPEKIEVMIWPYEYAPEPSIQWKEDWPSLSDPETVRRGDSYSLFLPAGELAALKAFLATRNPKGAVEIDGGKWSVSFRIPFPHERLWMAPNQEVD